MTDYQRYETALAAMRDGVDMERDAGLDSLGSATLRVGVNAAMVTQAALVIILVRSGFMTEAEFMVVLADEMEAEVTRYEERIFAGTGHVVRLNGKTD